MHTTGGGCLTGNEPYQPAPQRRTYGEEQMKAQVCPVCDGKGTVPGGFYPGEGDTSASRQTCRSCKGRGIVFCSEGFLPQPIRPREPYQPYQPWYTWISDWQGKPMWTS